MFPSNNYYESNLSHIIYYFFHSKVIFLFYVYKARRIMIFDKFFVANYIEPTASATRFVTSFWWIFCVIITATYSANLVAFLTVDKYHPPFNTLYELSQQTEFKFGTQGGTAFRTYFEVRVLRRMFIISEFFKVSVFRQLVIPF